MLQLRIFSSNHSPTTISTSQPFQKTMLHPNQPFNIPNFQIYRHDRPNGYGGALLMIRNSIPPPRNIAPMRLTLSLITFPPPSSLLASNSLHPLWQSHQFIFLRTRHRWPNLWRTAQPQPPNRHSCRRLQRHITSVGQFKLQRSRYPSWRRHLRFFWFHLI